MHRPEFIPQDYHEDDRAQRLLDIFNLPKGQINLSYVNSTDHIVAWHMHKKQIDRWLCLKGSFKVGLAQEPRKTRWTSGGASWYSEVTWLYLSDKNFQTLVIPPLWYHGYKALEPGSILLYHTSAKYDPEDEIRKEVGYFGDMWTTENR